MEIEMEVDNSMGAVTFLLKQESSPEFSQASGGDYRLEVNEFLADPFIAKVEAARVDRLLKLIRASRIPAFSPCEMGCDGVTYTLKFNEGGAGSTFTWWVEEGKGWGALKRIVREIESIAEGALGRPIRYLQG